MTTEFDLSSFVTRGRIVSVRDDGDQQLVRVRGYRGEDFTDVSRVSPHGESANPPVGAVGYFLRLGPDRIIALGYETPQRVKNLPTGAKAIYDSAGGVLKIVGDMSARPAPGKNVYLGGDGPGDGSYARVMTEAGPSINVYARIG